VTKAFDVVVIGAGAAGLMAAIRAGQRGRRVLLPVRDRPGGGRHRPARRPQFFQWAWSSGRAAEEAA
jgi:predicted flavoprotein YhiN